MIHLLDGSKPGGFAPEPLSIAHGGLVLTPPGTPGLGGEDGEAPRRSRHPRALRCWQLG